MAKSLYVCPECHVQVKDLKGHQARVHGKAKVTPNTKTLELKVEKPKERKEPEAKSYHCVDCGNPLTKGQTPCPKCGTTLDWSSVNG